MTDRDYYAEIMNLRSELIKQGGTPEIIMVSPDVYIEMIKQLRSYITKNMTLFGCELVMVETLPEGTMLVQQVVW